MSEEIVTKIQKSSVQALNEMTKEALDSVEREVVHEIGSFVVLTKKADEVLMRFVLNLNNNFDELLDREVVKDETIFDFETLSLVQEEELEVMVALEGMVNAARNANLTVFIGFNTRLSTMFPQKRINESSNPLDPEQVASAFQEAIRPINLDAQNGLAIFRAFNTHVLKKLHEVVQEADSVLASSNIIPNLGMDGGSKKSQSSSARSTPRAEPTNAFGTVEEEKFEQDEQPELFSMMQNLMHSEAPAGGAPAGPGPAGGVPAGGVPGGVVPGGVVPGGNVPGGYAAPQGGMAGGAPAPQQYMIPAGMVPAGMVPADGSQPAGAMQPFQPQAGQTVEMVDQSKLMEILSDIQEKLAHTAPAAVPTSLDDVEKLDISQSLGEILQEKAPAEGVVSAVDRQSSDVINLVTLLYEAIWQDPSVPIPIKELIGRTQITIIKVALADTNFFNNENHSARAILNEFAAAGIGWTEVEELAQDPLYQKIRELVDRILTEYTDDISLFDELIDDFKNFRAQEAAKTRRLEQRILKADERQERLDDIHELVSQKVDERVLGRELHPFVDELLHDPYHKFMVMLVLKEGPGSNAWKQAINTIDVLLWSVQPKEHVDDRGRLETVNPRLLNNLRKAFRIADIGIEKIDELITQLISVQEETFEDTPAEESKADEAETADELSLLSLDEVQVVKDEEDDELAGSQEDPGAAIAFESPETAEALEAGDGDISPNDDLPEDDPHMIQVANLSVGVWVEFAGEEDTNTRCKLAAKINAIDKFIFVNRQGVKVVEKTKMGLAKEIRDNTVSVISDGLLFSRALESVIGDLRETQHEQQTGSAYQPEESA